MGIEYFLLVAGTCFKMVSTNTLKYCMNKIVIEFE